MSKIVIIECCPFHEQRLIDAFAAAGIQNYRRTNDDASVEIMKIGLPMIFEVTAGTAQIEQVRERAASISRGYSVILHVV